MNLEFEARRRVHESIRDKSDVDKLKEVNRLLAEAGMIVDDLLQGGASDHDVVMDGWTGPGVTETVRLQGNVMKACFRRKES